jgi:hypothetical protein
MATRKKQEESLQLSISRFLKLQFPNVIFTAESSGLKLTMGQAIKAKLMRSSRALPDMLILHPTSKYHGLCLELKKEGTCIIVSVGDQKGQLTADKHIREQYDILLNLRKKGYYAEFAVGADQAIEIIRKYMAGEELPIYYTPTLP